MCAINPAHKKRFILDVYTSGDMSKEDFQDRAIGRALIAEIRLNERADLRWHVKETDQQAD
jgi:hypothetical protein